jgi:hypothetical protein
MRTRPLLLEIRVSSDNLTPVKRRFFAGIEFWDRHAARCQMIPKVAFIRSRVSPTAATAPLASATFAAGCATPLFHTCSIPIGPKTAVLRLDRQPHTPVDPLLTERCSSRFPNLACRGLLVDDEALRNRATVAEVVGGAGHAKLL